MAKSNCKTESELSRLMTKTLEAAGAVVLSLVGSSMQQPGWPDRLIIHRDFRGFVEAKRGQNPLSTAQQLRIRACTRRDMPVLVVRYMQELDCAWIEGVDDQGACVRLGQIGMRTVTSGLQTDGKMLLEAFKTNWFYGARTGVHASEAFRGYAKGCIEG